MCKYVYTLLSLCVVSSATQAAWEEKFYNPQPLENDVILPLPCEGNMVFRVVRTNTQQPLEDTLVTLGGNREQDGLWASDNICIVKRKNLARKNSAQIQ